MHKAIIIVINIGEVVIEIYTSYAGAAGEMLHINGIFTIRKLK
jgi:hypothetical protein